VLVTIYGWFVLVDSAALRSAGTLRT
jgi:hypothetical protein